MNRQLPMNAMERRRIQLLLVVAVAVMLAGCTAPEDLNVPDTNPSNDPVEVSGVDVTGPQCTVDGTACNAADITPYSIPEISIGVVNEGEGTIELDLNGGRAGGRQVLSSMCNSFTIKEFRAQKGSSGSSRDVSTMRTVQLDAGERLDLTWFVEAIDDIDTSESVIGCLLQFDIDFEQRLRTVKQIQVRGSEDIPVATGLDDFTTSQRPVELVIDVEESAVQEIIGGEIKPVQARGYVVDHGGGEITELQHPSRPEQIHISTNGIPRQECTSQRIANGGNRSSAADEAILCRLMPERVQSSQIYDVVAETAYRYNIELPTVELALQPLEVSR